MKKTRGFLLAASLSLAFSTAFAQEEPEKAEPKKFAVYAYGASEAGINKSFASKLLSAITQSGKYAEIRDSEAFYKELAKSGEESVGQIAQAAKRHGADFVCAVSMTEAFGAYSITARIIKTSDSQTIRTASADRSLKSLDDLTRVSNELASQLLGSRAHAPPPAAAPPPPASAAAPVPAPPGPAAAFQKECAAKLNINEIAYKIQSGFAALLKDCSSALAKEIALSKSPFAKKAAPEPRAFMTSCAIDGIKQKLPAGADEYVKPVQSFVQNLLNAASAGGSLDVAKLSSAIGSMNVMELVNDIKAKAANDLCIVNEPYKPPAARDYTDEDEDEEGDEENESIVSLGFRLGFNFSHLYAEYSDGYKSTEGSYNSTPGFQAGLVLDIAPSEVFHIQPGLMYVQKGAEDRDGDALAFHYIEIPFLFSLKFSALRLNAGPYFGICLSGGCGADFGFSTGFGFDIGMFYMGMSYNYGLTNVSDRRGWDYYNRTLGFNFGVNL